MGQNLNARVTSIMGQREYIFCPRTGYHFLDELMHVHISLAHALNLDMHGALYVRVQLHFIQIPIVDATRCTILYLGGGHQSRYDHVYKKNRLHYCNTFLPLPVLF